MSGTEVRDWELSTSAGALFATLQFPTGRAGGYFRSGPRVGERPAAVKGSRVIAATKNE